MGPLIGLVLCSLAVGAVLWLFFHRGADDRRWLDSASHVDHVCYAVYGVCALLLFADLLYERHPHFAFESWFGSWLSFSGIYGFVSCVGLVLVAKLLRRVIRRDEDYYD